MKVVDGVMSIIGDFVAGRSAVTSIDQLTSVLLDVYKFYTNFYGQISGTVEGVNVRNYIVTDGGIFLEANIIIKILKLLFIGIIPYPPVKNGETIVSDGYKAFAPYIDAKVAFVHNAIAGTKVDDALNSHIDSLKGLRVYFSSAVARMPGLASVLPKVFTAALNIFVLECILESQLALSGQSNGLVKTVGDVIATVVDSATALVGDVVHIIS